MATKKLEEIGLKKDTPVLKKRIAPGEGVSEEVVEKKSPLKKRTTPLDEPNAEKSVATLLKKKENPLDETAKPSPLKKKKNPFDTADEEPKEKSSLDKTIYDALIGEELHFDEIIEKTHLDAKVLLTMLMRMEIKGIVNKLPGNIYKINQI